MEIFGKSKEIRIDFLTDKDGKICIEVGTNDCFADNNYFGIDYIGREDAVKIVQSMITAFHLTGNDIRLYE